MTNEQLLNSGLLLALLLVGCGDAGGRAVSPPTVPPPTPAPAPEPEPESEPEPRECTNEREMAFALYADDNPDLPALVRDWIGEPFRFYFDTEWLPEEDIETAARMIDAARRMSSHIEDQIGYSIIEVEGSGWFAAPNRPDCGSLHREWRETGTVLAWVYPELWRNRETGEPEQGAVTASHCATVKFWGGMDEEENDSVIVHEIFHHFGYTHSPLPLSNGRPHSFQTPPGVGVPMSVELTGGIPSPGLSLTFDDVDALRCIFPEGG